MPYRLGGTGSDNTIDCINLVYRVLECLEIDTPEFNSGWYSASSFKIMRDFRHWGVPVSKPSYNGDTVLLTSDRIAFGVVWDRGLLTVSEATKAVSWNPLSVHSESLLYCFRSRNNSPQRSD